MSNSFSIITIFPDMVNAYLGCSILKRALDRQLISVAIYNLRDHSTDKHHSVDDYSFGGGPGMVMKPEIFFRLIEQQWPARNNLRVIMPSPRGRVFTQSVAREFADESKELLFLCGRYEAIDERVSNHLVDDEISIGDYVLTGGELPALVIIDAVSRLLPDVLGDSQSADNESFSHGLLDYPHYTRPELFRDMSVPKVLLSGNHEAIRKWRMKESLRATLHKRPDLLELYTLSAEEKLLLEQIKEEAS